MKTNIVDCDATYHNYIEMWNELKKWKHITKQNILQMIPSQLVLDRHN